MTESTVTTTEALVPSAAYHVLAPNGDQTLGTVWLTGVGKQAAYGVDCASGNRVVLQPIEEYIDCARLRRVNNPAEGC